MITSEIYEMVMDLYNYRCAECETSSAVEIHHQMPKTKVNIKLYPLFIDSPINLIPLCGGVANGCHEKTKNIHKIRDREAKMYETYLRSMKDADCK